MSSPAPTATDLTAWATRFLAPMNDHDADAAAAFYTEDGFWEFTEGPNPDGQAHSGRSGIRQAITDIFAEVPDIHYEPLQLQAGPDHVVMEVLVTGTTRGGKSLRYHACDVITPAEGDLVAGKRSYRKVVS